MDMSFEVGVIPVSDEDRAKGFYGKLEWRVDVGFPYDNGFRIVQFTLPGSNWPDWHAAYIVAGQPGTDLPA